MDKLIKIALWSFGLASTFSFYPNKHITTGEGGMILTDDECFNTLKQSKNLFSGKKRDMSMMV